MYPFERITESAKKVLALAQEDAETQKHSYIGTEHLLVGLLRETDGLAAKVLKNLGVELDKVRAAITSILGNEEFGFVHQIIPTSRVQKVIEISFEEAGRMKSDHVATEHLLLALLIEGQGIAAHVLEDLGATIERVRAELSRSDLVNDARDQEPWRSPGLNPYFAAIASQARAEGIDANDVSKALEEITSVVDRLFGQRPTQKKTSPRQRKPRRRKGAEPPT
jgi:ATP-dependent Clp protease ATP-binding subunit ClpC